MKLYLHLLCICFICGFQSTAQNVTNYGPFALIPDNTFNFNYLTEKYILLDKYSVIGNLSYQTKKAQTYYTLDLSSNSGISSQKIIISHEGKSAKIIKAFYTESNIIEFVDFAAGTTSNKGIGALKRDPKTLEIIGDVTIIDGDIQYSVNSPNINLQKISTGYIYTRIMNNQCFVSYLDEDFNETEKIALKDANYSPTLLQTSSNSPFVQVNEHDELILTTVGTLNNDLKSFYFEFTVVKPNGTVIFSSSLNLGETIPKNFKITYNHKSNTIEGFIFWYISPVMKGTQVDQPEKTGYLNFTLDENGNSLVNQSKEFTLDDILGQYKDELIKKYSEEELKNDLSSYFSVSEIISTADGNYLIINWLTWKPELKKSLFITKIDKAGKQAWSQMLFSTVRNDVNQFLLTPNKDLQILLEDLNSTNLDGKHQTDIFKKENQKEGHSIFNFIIDQKTGEFIENKLVDLDLPPDTRVTKISCSEDRNKYLIESVLGKSIYFSVIEFD